MSNSNTVVNVNNKKKKAKCESIFLKGIMTQHAPIDTNAMKNPVVQYKDMNVMYLLPGHVWACPGCGHLFADLSSAKNHMFGRPEGKTGACAGVALYYSPWYHDNIEPYVPKNSTVGNMKCMLKVKPENIGKSLSEETINTANAALVAKYKKHGLSTEVIYPKDKFQEKKDVKILLADGQYASQKNCFIRMR